MCVYRGTVYLSLTAKNLIQILLITLPLIFVLRIVVIRNKNTTNV